MPLNTVMVVEDSESEQFLIKRKISVYAPQVKILTAYDGQEALELLEHPKNRPDGILLDINMPRMNGFEFLEAYSKKIDKADAIVCMLSSSSQDQDKERALSFECVKHYFVKPMMKDDFGVLVELIESEA